MKNSLRYELHNIAINAAVEAGKAILDVYVLDFEVEYKEDQSPLTAADKKAHNIINEFLKETDIPVLSEEGKSIPYDVRRNWDRLWIVDPLDGTKEFVKKNGEFTINIALVESGSPVFGVVYAPVLGDLYVGIKEEGAWKTNYKTGDGKIEWKEIKKIGVRLPAQSGKDYYGVVASRSHLSKETEVYIERIKEKHDNVIIVSKGSSLKLCMVAEGIADVYPRFAPTSEWDTAAGHAIVVASGAQVVQALNEENELHYNKEDILNPWFIVKR